MRRETFAARPTGIDKAERLAQRIDWCRLHEGLRVRRAHGDEVRHFVDGTRTSFLTHLEQLAPALADL